MPALPERTRRAGMPAAPGWGASRPYLMTTASSATRLRRSLVDRWRMDRASVDQAELGGGGVDGDEEGAGHVGEGDDGLAGGEAGEAFPQAVVDAADGAPQ